MGWAFLLRQPGAMRVGSPRSWPHAAPQRIVRPHREQPRFCL